MIARFYLKKRNKTKTILGILFMVAGILLIVVWVPLWMWVFLLGCILIIIGAIILKR